ncbi:MAG: biotin carboxylase N-terminal domain-containing protein [Planctomycetota bacterium]
MPRFRKLLVANRGEIACRVIRSARALGYATVAVYSDADRDAPHVRLADEAVRLGPAPVGESYLSLEALLQAAGRSGADALHPGYGFLSERADLARACAWGGLVFVGPPAEAIELMGDKARAKVKMRAAGVPCLPGYDGEAQDDAALLAAAEGVGFPLLVKAAAGGGGRGMRRVERPADLPAALAGARSEAQNAFGDGRLLLERLVERARHVEVQVLADEHGKVLHLGERDCSAQRRYQKVLEEAPSPAVDEALRARLGAAATAAARAIGYVGAGTVELLLAPDHSFSFLEMNTRLQVEHPVTELVTGLDLVELQLRVAAGEPLPLEQEQVRLRGHAIEVRLYAEDPAQGFLPQTGRLLAWEAPEGEGLRTDHGLAPGFQVTPHYDPLLAKLIAVGQDREEARRRLLAGLRRTVALGVSHNKAFLQALLEHETCVAGELTTGFLESPAAESLRAAPAPSAEAVALAAVLGAAGPAAASPFGALARPFTRRLLWGERLLPAHVRRTGPRSYEVAIKGEAVEGEAVAVELLDADPRPGRLRVDLAGLTRWAQAAWDGERLEVELDGRAWVFHEERPRGLDDAAEAEGGLVLRAPGDGRVVAVKVAAGDEVEAGQPAVVIEAMKIETTLSCATAGRVAEVRVAAGAAVKRGALLVRFEEDGGAEG